MGKHTKHTDDVNNSLSRNVYMVLNVRPNQSLQDLLDSLDCAWSKGEINSALQAMKRADMVTDDNDNLWAVVKKEPTMMELFTKVMDRINDNISGLEADNATFRVQLKQRDERIAELEAEVLTLNKGIAEYRNNYLADDKIIIVKTGNMYSMAAHQYVGIFIGEGWSLSYETTWSPVWNEFSPIEEIEGARNPLIEQHENRIKASQDD